MPAAARLASAGHPRRWLAVLFTVYLLLLLWVVLFKLGVPFIGDDDLRRLKPVPFAAGGGVSANTPFELGVNVLLFVPFGLYLGLLAPRWPWWKAVGVIASASLLLEVAQYVLAIGVSDVTDVLVNSIGGLAGYGMLAWIRHGLQERTTAVMVRICTWTTVLALLAAGAFAASPLRYGQQGNAADDSPRESERSF
ncbi:MAG TPA: VanZ family protein [Arthrobacter sp.]|nr:VanZ family protein [Arthrobacter sp.]